MSRAKRHHHSAQAYLKHFANGNERVMVYDRLRQATWQTHIRNAAVENDLYTVTDAGGNPSDLYEAGWLQWFDSVIARILPKLLEARPPLTTGDRGMVCLFLALQHVRTPYMREQIHNVVDLMMRLEVEETFSGRSGDELDRAIDAWDPNATAEEKAQIRRTALDPSHPIDMNNESWIKAMLRHVPDLAEGLETREWILVEAQDATFLTGDRPVVVGGFHPLRLSNAPYVCWPLSPTKMLALGEPGSANAKFRGILVAAEYVHAVNQLIAGSSAAQIYWRPDTDPTAHISLPVGPHINTVDGIPVKPGERYYDKLRTAVSDET